MSRSYRKTPIAGLANGKNASARRKAGKARRRANKVILSQLDFEDEDVIFIEEGELSSDNPYSWPTDGESWFGDFPDEEYVAERLRK